MHNPTFDEIKALPHETKVKVKITNYSLTEGVISHNKDGKRVFICTNTINGNRAEDKLTYACSWEVDRMNIHMVEIEHETSEVYPII